MGERRYLKSVFLATAAIAILAHPPVAARPAKPPQPVAPVLSVKGPHYAVPVGKAPVKGPADALVTIIAYMDFLCPFCELAFSRLLSIASKHPKDVRLVFKHFPLAFRPNAHLAAQAAVEAQNQNKFWETAPLIFKSRTNLDVDTLNSIAAKQKLNRTRMKKALANRVHEARVNNEFREGRSFGVKGTPTVFINGTMHVGARSEKDFEKIVKTEIAKAQSLLKSKSLKRGDLYAELLKTGIQKAKQAPGSRTTHRVKSIKTAKSADPGAIHAKIPQFHTFSPEIKETVNLTLEGAPSLGPDSADITIVWFGGFNCYDFRRIMQAWFYVAERHGNSIRLVFKHHIAEDDQTGFFTAQVLREAHRQGLFWELTSLFATTGHARDRNSVLKNAMEAGMDMEKLTNALNKQVHGPRVLLDLSEARAFGGRFNRNQCGSLLLPNGETFQGYVSGYNLDRTITNIFSDLRSSRVLIPLP